MIARSMEDVVPEETRSAIRDAFRETFEKSAPVWIEKTEARRALYEALAAEPFDAEAVKAAFARIRELDDALTAAFQDTLARELGELTAGQRAALAERLREIEARREKWRERRRGGPPDDGPPPPGP